MNKKMNNLEREIVRTTNVLNKFGGSSIQAADAFKELEKIVSEVERVLFCKEKGYLKIEVVEGYDKC